MLKKFGIEREKNELWYGLMMTMEIEAGRKGRKIREREEYGWGGVRWF
jgi:hypothetical protein